MNDNYVREIMGQVIQLEDRPGMSTLEIMTADLLLACQEHASWMEWYHQRDLVLPGDIALLEAEGRNVPGRRKELQERAFLRGVHGLRAAAGKTGLSSGGQRPGGKPRRGFSEGQISEAEAGGRLRPRGGTERTPTEWSMKSTGRNRILSCRCWVCRWRWTFSKKNRSGSTPVSGAVSAESICRKDVGDCGHA